MSRLADEAVAAFGRWRQMNPDMPAPPVKVVLANGDEYLFNGLAVAPAAGSPETVSISALGIPLPILVVRDGDITRVEIGQAGIPAMGFVR